MKTESRRTKWRWVLVAASLLIVAMLAAALLLMRNCRALACVSGATKTQCTNVSPPQVVQRLPTSDSQELILEQVRVSRRESNVSVEVTLKGNFWNESDQNLYAFVGQTRPGAGPVSYSLSSDAGYFAGLPYEVRNAVALPHDNDVRVGVMAPREAAYTPQVYAGDAVRAYAVGRDAHVSIEVSEHVVRLSLPLEELYRARQSAVPERVSLTIATARDYVGFVDQLSVRDVASGETKQADPKPSPPALYPTLNYDSHILKSVTLDASAQPARVEFETAAEITDWAQTNLFFYFVPYPAPKTAARPQDPSKTVTLPYAWSLYCAVYSPTRVFCKASNGTDFTYDEGYAERSALEGPTDVRFNTLGGARYALELGPRSVATAKGGGDDFALLMTVGKDGFGPTSVYGWELSRRCALMRRFLGVATPGAISQPLCR